MQQSKSKIFEKADISKTPKELGWYFCGENS